jgi:hypothetical protein
MIKGSIEEILPAVDQFVEATFFEKRTLWTQFKDSAEWIESCNGLGMAVGPHNTYIMFWFHQINGKLVAFYEPTSLVVYWDDVNDFIRSFGKPYTNATNYHPIK